MSDERLHFDEGAGPPDVMTAAEHLARYAVLAPFVRGKRVLDMACGEGYGSWFLREWGASEVVGIDISADAIENARRHFGRDGVTFRLGDACGAADQLEQGSFDLVVSFETVEHVDAPERLLEGLSRLCAPGGGIFVSCPNDHIAMPEEASNPFHRRKYTFEEFKQLSESILGTASQWLLGSNVQGYALIPIGEPVIEKLWDDWRDIVESRAFPEFHLLPSQANVRPDQRNVLYYLGVWGVDEQVAAAAVTAQSFTAFVEPWKTIDWLKAQLASASASAARDERSPACPMPDVDGHQLCRRLAEDVAETRHRVLVLAGILKAVAAERDRLQLFEAKADELEVASAGWEAETMALRLACATWEAETTALGLMLERIPALELEVRRLEAECTDYEVVIADLRAVSGRVPSLEAEVRNLTARLKEAEAESGTLRALAVRLPSLESEIRARDEHLSRIFRSRSWRWTRIIRLGGRVGRGEFGAVKESFRRLIQSRHRRD